MSKLFVVISEYHGVSAGEIRQWTGRRNLAFDLLVFLSFLVGFCVASGLLMRRLFNGWSFSGALPFALSYCPTPYRCPIVLKTMRPSEIAGVAITTSFMSFLAIGFMSGVAEMTYTSPSSLEI